MSRSPSDAAAEADRIARVARGQQTVRIPDLVDPEEIQRRFGDRAVPYDYEVAGRRYRGVIVPERLARTGQ